MILCIETTSTNCSVALGNEGALVALKEDYSDTYSHAERLHVFIDEILDENQIKIKDLKAVAVSSGPGSYTGLRIGVSAAKGLCFSQSIPLLSVPTLKALAYEVNPVAGKFVVPLIDARRMEVYTCGFTAAGEIVLQTQAHILSSDSFTELLEEGRVTFIGSGVEKFKKICQHPNASFVTGRLPSAANMIPFAERQYQEEKFEDLAYYVPFYLKDFKAG